MAARDLEQKSRTDVVHGDTGTTSDRPVAAADLPVAAGGRPGRDRAERRANRWGRALLTTVVVLELAGIGLVVGLVIR